MAVRDFAMFTPEGNAAVQGIVSFARVSGANWPVVYDALRALADSDPDQFGEALDTAVREVVYDALGFTESFYI